MAALMAMVLSSCMTPKPTMFSTYVNTIDYYSIGLNGKVLLTESNSYSGEYESLGSIIVQQNSGHVAVDVKTTKKKVSEDDDIYGSSARYKDDVKYKVGEWKNPSYSEALQVAVEKAVEMGGDAIINLKFDNIGTGTVFVSGMVIKRK